MNWKLLRHGFAFVLCLTVFTGCASPRPVQYEARPREPVVRSEPEMVRETVTPDPAPAPPQTTRTVSTRPRPRARSRISLNQLPSILHPEDKSVMVLIRSDDPADQSGGRDKGDFYLDNAYLRSESRSFYMDQKEISVEQFKTFKPDYDETVFTHGKACPKCPAMGIDWFQANDYCLKFGKRLPTEKEWKQAAIANRLQDWPWGRTLTAKHANLLGEEDGYRGVAPGGSFPKGASPFGVFDMVGNVWEWVITPYRPSSGPGNPNPSKVQTLRMVKGGSWSSPADVSKVSFQNIVDPSLKNPTFGFRCVKPA